MPNAMSSVLGGMKRIGREFLPWMPDYQGGPPLNRDLTVGFAQIERVLADGKVVPVGTFLPEHYVLAELGSLRCQILESEWKAAREAKKLPVTPLALKSDRPDLYKALYREEKDKPVRKTSLELAIFPSYSLRRVEYFIEKEYTFLKNRQLSIPAMVSKFRIQPDFFENLLEEAGLRIRGATDNRKVNIHNPTPSTREKILHYAGQFFSIITTAVAAVGTMELLAFIGAATPLAIGAGVVAGYLTRKRGADFGFYDMAEGLHRDLGWLTDKRYITGKVSPSKAILTGIYVAAIALTVVLAGVGAWMGGMALPLSLFAKAGLSASALSIAQTAFAGLLAGIAAVATLMSTVYPMRYFDTFSPFDNQIHTTKAVADALPVVNLDKSFSSKLSQVKEALLDKADKPKYGFSEQNRQEFAAELDATFLRLQQRFGALAPALDEANKPQPRRSPRNHSPSPAK
ncbi:MAG: hypothetical protein AB7I18_12505 [Candidatus Berkiella sp.]